jgi:SAM-dependent methyltransferase
MRDVPSLELDLAAYYDAEAGQRAARGLDPRRVEMREQFVAQLAGERRTRLVEIGTGPGRDATAFLAAGCSVSGVDLSAEHVRLSRDVGVDAYVATAQQLPFADDAFDAGWTMSTLLHIPDDGFDAALREICRVLRPGSPLAVGLWGGPDWEGHSVKDEIQPPRFFSLRSHDRIRSMLGHHATIESFETWSGARDTSWEYQWAVLRTA